MAEYDLVDESPVGVLVRTRVRQFGEKHPETQELSMRRASDLNPHFSLPLAGWSPHDTSFFGTRRQR
jgi:hypothetical protein